MSDTRSIANFVAAIVVYRVIKIWPTDLSNVISSLRLKGGTDISFGWNRGDIQGIREIFLDENYRIPTGIRSENLVDLGANIGLATIYLCKKVGFRRVVAVEPSARNVCLMRRNFARNHIDGEILEAAVAHKEGKASLLEHQESNLGTVILGHGNIDTVTMETIISKIPDNRIDLLKIDIEGSEKWLITNDAAWLDNVDSIIAEFHLNRDSFIKILESKGFVYFPPANRDVNARHLSDFFLRT